jgi:hypothetical protein
VNAFCSLRYAASKAYIPFLLFASPCIIILSAEFNQQDAANSQVYYLSFKYS